MVDKWWIRGKGAGQPPPPPHHSYAIVQATVGIGTVLIWNLIEFGTKCSAIT